MPLLLAEKRVDGTTQLVDRTKLSHDVMENLSLYCYSALYEVAVLYAEKRVDAATQLRYRIKAR